MLGPLFPSEYRKKAYIQNFEGGGFGGPKILYAGFLRVLFSTREEKASCPQNGSPAIPGPEMTLPIVWVPGIVGLFLQEKNSLPIKFLVFYRGGNFGLAEVPILLLWARGFSERN